MLAVGLLDSLVAMLFGNGTKHVVGELNALGTFQGLDTDESFGAEFVEVFFADAIGHNVFHGHRIAESASGKEVRL